MQATEYLEVDAIYRYQWVNIIGAPKSMNISAHSPLRNTHIGLGMNVFYEGIGPTITQGALAAFSYRILFPNSKLSFGIEAGYKYKDIDWSKVNPNDIEDPIFRAQVKHKVVPDASFGIYYSTKKYYLGLSSKQLLQNEMNIVSINGKNEYSKLLRHFYSIGGNLHYLVICYFDQPYW
ncbi:MAG: PorP/SprF family type IX secretion system membrane protein [Chitinophagaceae bacterium]|nr:PorP/SprF family type IX secretion system membrane protein [Chitinophagaceae bacterium]